MKDTRVVVHVSVVNIIHVISGTVTRVIRERKHLLWPFGVELDIADKAVCTPP